MSSGPGIPITTIHSEKETTFMELVLRKPEKQDLELLSSGSPWTNLERPMVRFLEEQMESGGSVVFGRPPTFS